MPIFIKQKTVCKSGVTCLFPHHKVDEQPEKKAPKEHKNAVAIVKIVSQMVCVSQDSEFLDYQRGKQAGCKFRAGCSFPHWKFEEQPNKKPKKGDDKSAAAVEKSVRQLSCVSQDTEPPESTATSRQGT